MDFKQFPTRVFNCLLEGLQVKSTEVNVESNNVELGGWGLMNMQFDKRTVSHYPFKVKLHHITFVTIINGWNVLRGPLKQLPFSLFDTTTFLMEAVKSGARWVWS